MPSSSTTTPTLGPGRPWPSVPIQTQTPGAIGSSAPASGAIGTDVGGRRHGAELGHAETERRALALKARERYGRQLLGPCRRLGEGGSPCRTSPWTITSRPTASPALRSGSARPCTPADAVLWSIEHDPVLRSTITAIGLFDKAPDWERLVARLEQAVVTGAPPGPAGGHHARSGSARRGGCPTPTSTSRYHLRRVEAPEPRDLSAVLAIAQPIAMAAFDRERPLWEFTVVEGLADGRAALIQKVHHSLTDGVGGVELALALLDDRRRRARSTRPTPLPHGRPPRAARLRRAAAAGRHRAGGRRHPPRRARCPARPSGCVPQLGELVPVDLAAAEAGRRAGVVGAARSQPHPSPRRARGAASRTSAVPARSPTAASTTPTSPPSWVGWPATTPTTP